MYVSLSYNKVPTLEVLHEDVKITQRHDSKEGEVTNLPVMKLILALMCDKGLTPCVYTEIYQGQIPH